MRSPLHIGFLSLLGACCVHAQEPEGMVWVPAGEFTMGWDGDGGRYDERPAHRVRTDGFWMDATEVTNAQFRTFVEATGYVTTAERKPDWEELKTQLPPGTPRPPEDVLVAGSLVFTPPFSSQSLVCEAESSDAT